MSDEASPEQMENGLAFKRAMGLLAAVGVAAAIGLATVDTIDTDSGERALPTDASAQRGPGYAAPAPNTAPASTGTRGELDPAMNHPDRGNDHHG
jgi:hypothetical protein